MYRPGRLTWRLALFAAVLALSSFGLIGRLVHLQILQHDYYLAQARDEHLSRQVVRAPRGAILDRAGYPLATTIDAYDIYVERKTWQDGERAREAAGILAPILNRAPQDILAQVLTSDKGDALLAGSLDFDLGRRIIEAAPPGVKAVNTTARRYPEGDLASALLGFTGRDHVGLAGLESDFDDVLGGTPGNMYFERDSVGNPIALGRSYGKPPVAGADVRLTIDREIQRLIEAELDKQIQSHKASGGSIIVMNPRTGAILGMASRPSFQLSKLNLNDESKAELYRNRAVTDLYEPGSVMKTITMAMAIDLGLVSPSTTYVDTGTAIVDGATISNWDFGANGTTTATQLLQKSLNTGAVWLSGLIGPERFYDYLRRFGFGERTHAGFGGESPGLIRAKGDDGWRLIDLATNSYGQGVAATPLQMIAAVAALANGGKLMRPYVVEEVVGPGGRRTFQPVVVRQVVSESTAKTLVQMMTDVVEGVPYHLARVPGYHVAGKTGTTLVSIPGGYALNSTIPSFVGFAPSDDPKMIMLIKIDQPQDDELGGRVAAPIFGTLAPKILAHLGVEPNKAEGQ